MKVSIVLPIYNEEQAIGSVINELKAVMKKTPYAYEIIAVDDGSTDRTRAVLDRISGIRIIKHPYNKGYGAALKTGIKAAKFDYVLMMDADGTYPTDAIPELMRYATDYDMVVGARTGKKVKIPLIRRPAKFILNFIANILAKKKIPDLNSGMRIFKKEIALRFFHLFPSTFSFTTTITLAALTNDYNVKFVPINYYKRKGKSVVRPREFLNFLILIFRITTYFEPLRIFLPISLLIFLLGMIVAVYQFITIHNFAQLPVTLLLAALQIGFLGLIADLIVRRK